MAPEEQGRPGGNMPQASGQCSQPAGLRHYGGSERAFSLLELLAVLLVIVITATAAVVQINRVINQYDLTRFTSELVGQFELVRAECMKQNDGYPAAAILVRNNSATPAYSTQFYNLDSMGNPTHTDYNYNAFRSYVLLVSPANVTYTFNPRGKSHAYGSNQYDPTQKLAVLPTITVQHITNTNLKRTITITIAGSIRVQ